MNIGLPELIVILIVALLVIGPKRLPDVAQALGKGLAEFRRAMEDVKDNLKADDVRRDLNDMKESLLYKKSDDENEEKAPFSEKDQPGRDPSQASQPQTDKPPVEGS